MSRDGSGNFTLLGTLAPPNSQSNSTTINQIMADIATGLSDSINKAGTRPWTANQSLGGYKLTNSALASAHDDVPTLRQVQKGNVQRASSTSGSTADAYVLAFSPSLDAYTTGMKIRWPSVGTNTVTGVTVNASGLGNKTLKKNATTGVAALAVGDIGAAGMILEAEYDGVDLILLNPLITVPAGTPEASVAEWRANTADRVLTTDIVYSAAERVSLTDAATIAVDLDAGFNFTVTLGGNRTLGQPTNQAVGKSGFIRIIQDGTGGKTLAYHTSWKFNGGSTPVLSTAANAVDILYYTVIDTDFIHASLNKDVKTGA